MGGWLAFYIKSNYVPETLSFSKIYSERSFSSCKIFFRQTDGPADRQMDRRTNLIIEAPFPELKNGQIHLPVKSLQIIF